MLLSIVVDCYRCASLHISLWSTPVLDLHSFGVPYFHFHFLHHNPQIRRPLLVSGPLSSPPLGCSRSDERHTARLPERHLFGLGGRHRPHPAPPAGAPAADRPGQADHRRFDCAGGEGEADRRGAATPRPAAAAADAAYHRGTQEAGSPEALPEHQEVAPGHRAVVEDALRPVVFRADSELPALRIPGDERAAHLGDVEEGGRRHGAGAADGVHFVAVRGR